MFSTTRRFLSQFYKDSDFLKALITSFGMVVPIVIGINFDVLPYTLSMAIGVLLSAGSDVPGSKRHKNFGILSATATVTLVSVLIGLAMSNQWLLIPLLAVVIFAVSIISVYGFRASLVSFAGLMTIVFSFAHPHFGVDVFIHGGMFATGGLWYLFLSNLFHPLSEKRQTVNLLADCMNLTGQLLGLKGELLLSPKENETQEKQILGLQVKINEEHEALRSVLLSEREKSGTSNYRRKQLLILIELIDMLELSVANPVNQQKIQELFSGNPNQLATFQKVLTALSARMSRACSFMQREKSFGQAPDWEAMLEACNQEIKTYVNSVGLPKAREGALLMHNLIDYLEKLIDKVQAMERVLLDLETDKQSLDPTTQHKFITQQDYDVRILKENLNFKSPIFRHAARLTVAMLLGYVLGMIFPVQNAYWIILTVVVIMRPGYTLTKERSKQRLYGTLIGAGVAGIMVFLIHNTVFFAILALLSLVLALSFMQKNYKTSSIFITTGVVFLYVLIEPNAFEVIGFRIIDTLTGAAIAMFSILFIWPSWESTHVKFGILTALKSNLSYLQQIRDLYEDKANMTNYKLARKQAFLAMGNLNAAFQRMSQEPKARQLDGIQMYKVVGLNHTLLAASAALGTFIKDNKNNLPDFSFDKALLNIEENLQDAIHMIEKGDIKADQTKEDVMPQVLGELEDQYAGLSRIRDKELEQESDRPIAPTMLKGLQTTRLISDQLKWMTTISQNLRNTIKYTLT
ncbi:FUSC family protein [Litoribacter alkaliphilus]|uniref:FUSC family protein n=1 Tax=Litoribacter ruber TaxID=702568 RepID=A0AAP2CIA5_9BACT|nr:FUSC family membrane protein [Litoribacter alkaliphilus]MBS9525258.1 FUSC family protein [Litoribacter alkaliphilus]